MNQILLDANSLLRNGNFVYAICGGFALDLFTNTDMRVHSDIDICVFEKDKDIIFRQMKDNKWVIYEFQGQGIVQLINDISELKSGHNLMCLKNDCEIIEFFPCDRGDNYFLHEFCNKGISDFNYIEFLFNTLVGDNFIFDNNTDIHRDMSKAIMKRNNIPYLSPELVLLYKAENFEREWYQFDFDNTIVKMNDEQITWFYNGLDILYPSGHKWRK